MKNWLISIVALAALLTVSACEGVRLASDVATAEAATTLRFASEKRLDVSVFSFCSTPYSTLVRRGSEDRQLAMGAVVLCGRLGP